MASISWYQSNSTDTSTYRNYYYVNEDFTPLKNLRESHPINDISKDKDIEYMFDPKNLWKD